MKNLKKLFVCMVLLTVCAGLFAQDWYVCAGSYSNNDNADEMVYALQKKGVSAFVYAYTKEDGTKLFRVLIDEPFESRDEARSSRDIVEQKRAIKDLNLSGLWICQAEKMPIVNVIPVQKMTKKEVKIVLGWNNHDVDLDSYLLTSSCQINYENTSENGITLEFDEDADYAPEIITISDLQRNEVYQYFVEDFDNCFDSKSTVMSNAGTTVKVYINDKCEQTFVITPNTQGTTWHVFDISNGELLIVNEVNNDSIGE